MGSFTAKIPLANNANLTIKTNIVPINVLFLIGIDKSMESDIIMDFEQHQLPCRKEDWEIPPEYPNDIYT